MEGFRVGAGAGLDGGSAGVAPCLIGREGAGHVSVATEQAAKAQASSMAMAAPWAMKGSMG